MASNAIRFAVTSRYNKGRQSDLIQIQPKIGYYLISKLFVRTNNSPKAILFFYISIKKNNNFIDNKRLKQAYIQNFWEAHNHRPQDKLLVIKIDLDQSFFAPDRA